MFVIMPKQTDAAVDENVVLQDRVVTSIVNKSNVVIGENVIGGENIENPFINFTHTIPGTPNWWRIAYNKWRHRKL